MLVTMMMLAMAAPNPSMLNAPRKTYSECIKQFENKSAAAKMDLASYTTALQGACGGEAGALTKALIDYDVAMGGKRASAVANADSDVADYRASSEERYREIMPPSAATAIASAKPPSAAPATVAGAAQKIDAAASK